MGIFKPLTYKRQLTTISATPIYPSLQPSHTLLPHITSNAEHARPIARTTLERNASRSGYSLATIPLIPSVQRKKSSFSAPLQEEQGQQFRSRIQAAKGSGHSLNAQAQQHLEQGVGMDLSGVRVHTGAAADQLSCSVHADAFTTGAHIFFRSGMYQPQSPSGLHLLAHEVTHVVQQATGPVTGNFQTGGISLSDPHDRFERAAETNARHILQGTTHLSTPPDERRRDGTSRAPASPGSGRTRGAVPTPSSAKDEDPTVRIPQVGASETTSNMHIQRRVGFEFEAEQDTWELKGWTRTDQDPTLANGGNKITDTKKKLYYDSAAHFGVGADNGHIEFITDALASWTEVKQTFDAMYSLAVSWSDINHGWYKAGTDKWISGLGYTGYRPYTKGKLPTVPQATVGSTLMNIPRLLLGLSEGVQGTFGTSNIAYKPEWYIQDKTVLKAIEDVREKVEIVYKQADTRIAEYMNTITSSAKSLQEANLYRSQAQKALFEAKGFFTSILLLLSQASIKTGIETKDDIKYRFGLMHRTDFSSAYASLSTEAQNFVQILLLPDAEDMASSDSDDEDTGASSPLAIAYGRKNVLAKAYIPPDTGNKKNLPGPTIEDWIDSILSPGSYRNLGNIIAELPKDIMSPPPGHRAHTGESRDEGLGAYDMDRVQGMAPLFLYELRGLAYPLYPDKWIELAKEICRLAAVTQNDPNLYPLPDK
jgi:hypothetical protein